MSAETTTVSDENSQQVSDWECGGRLWCGVSGINSAWLAACREFADRNAVAWPGGSWSYSQLEGRVAALAAALQSAGVVPGDRVGVSFRERRHWVIGLLAVIRVGAIYVPLDLNTPKARLDAMVADAGLGIVVSDEEGIARGFGCRWVNVDQGGSKSELLTGADAGVLALLYTSGSTGVPKGVVVEHVGVLNEVMAVGGLIDLKKEDRVLQFTSPGFDASLEEFLMTLLHGATLVPRPREAVEDFVTFTDYVEETGITVLDLPTAFFSAWCGWLRETGMTIPKRVRAAVIGGERLSRQALEDWQASGGNRVRLLNTYGPTEASIAATCQVIEGDWTEKGDPPIGRPMRGFKVRVVDEDGCRVEVGGTGELLIGGSCVGPGYWKRDLQTAKAFFSEDGDRWYRTGDLVKWDDQGRLCFCGRKDDQLKIRGHRIEPDEVIRLLEQHPKVAAAHAGPVEAGGGLHLAGWIRWQGDPQEDWVSRLREHLSDQLAHASIPTRWALVGEFKLTERGKLDRKSLPEPVAFAMPHESPATGTELRLAELWKDLIGVPGVGRDDDFFDLGGSSLLALRLFARIASEFGVKMPMAKLLGASRLRQLAGLIDGSDGESPADKGVPEIIPLRERGEGEPLFCVHGGDGGVLFYRELAIHLPDEVPLLSIESPELGAEGGIEAATVGEMARRYLQAVRKRQPEGPYHLAGYSFGGVMVYEMARLLVEAGEEVGFLGLFDTENPACRWRRYGMLERIRVYWRSLASFSPISRFGMMTSRMIEGVATNLRVKAEVRAAATAGITRPHSKLRMLQVREAHGKAMDAYVPPPLDLEVVLFKTEAVDDKFEVDSDYGWGDLVRKLTVADVAGEHLTMFDSEHVADLARRVEEHL